MSTKVSIDRIQQFHEDRMRLPYNDVFIARKMQIDKSNYSSYINGRLKITNGFLHRFYKAFANELAAVNGQPSFVEQVQLRELLIMMKELQVLLREQNEKLLALCEYRVKEHKATHN